MLTQLVFNLDFYEYLSERKHKKDYERIISRLLLNHRGAITKFFLYIDELSKCNDEDIAHWILFLSRKGVKDLTMYNLHCKPFKMPTHLFSCLELKNLDLFCFCFDLPASFHGFTNLLSLELGDMEFESGKLGEFLTQSCPALENLKLDHTSFQCQAKPIEIATLTNLKTLTLNISNFDNTVITRSSFIFEIVAFLPKLQELHLDFTECESFTEDDALRRSLTTFLRVKSLSISSIDLDSGIMLSFAIEMIRSFPNLQTLEVKAGKQDHDSPHAVCSSEADYNKMELLQLRSIVFRDSKGSKNEVCLIKYLLACSPFLKKFVIRPHSSLKSNETLMFTRKLLKLHRASPVAEIDVAETDL